LAHTSTGNDGKAEVGGGSQKGRESERLTGVPAHARVGRAPDPVPWWAITDKGWDLLRMIKSPRYG